MITRLENYGSHNSVQYGPAGLQGACQGLLRIDFDSGGGSWWPSTGCTPGSQITSSWTTQIGVRGLGHVSRGAGPTACDSAPPCYTYSGTQTVSITPATVGLAETVNQSIVNPGTTLAFNASPTAYLPSHTFWGITEWRWIPDAGSQSVQCVGWGDTCYFTPPGSGTMQVTGTMNGVVRTASVRVIVQCAIAGSTADSAFLRIANDTMTRQLGKRVWDSSGVTGPKDNRRERIGFWGTNSQGNRVLLFKSPTDSLDSPCHSWFSPSAIRTDVEFVQHHGHPFQNADTLPRSCLPAWAALDPTAYSTYNAKTYNGPSIADLMMLSGYPGWGVIYDIANIAVYRAPAVWSTDTLINVFYRVVGNDTTVFRVDTSVTLKNWQPYVRSYPRQQSSCAVY